MQFWELNRCFVIKGHMRAQEVVVGNKEGSKSYSAINAIEAVRRFNMVFIGSIEAFNKLFKRPKLLRLFIEVLKADDLVVLDRGIIV